MNSTTPLFERAVEYVRSGDPRDEPDLLRECLKAGNIDGLAATQKMSEDMYGGITFNFELKAPAAYCLPAWKEAGLVALVEAAQRTPTSKNRSLALEILSSLAARTRPKLFDQMVNDPGIAEVIGPIYDNGSLALEAQHQLNAFLLSISDEEEMAMAVGGQFQMSFMNMGASRQLFAALATRWLAINDETIAKFEELIQTRPDDEVPFQSFLERFPQILDPTTFRVWPKPDLHGAKEPDFVFQRIDNSYLIVEIETPSKLIVTRENQLSAQATQAVTQAIQYRSFLMERFSEAKAHFPDFQDPECLVVIGVETVLTEAQKHALLLENQSRNRVHIVGFDWLTHRARTIVHNVIRSDMRVQSIRMV